MLRSARRLGLLTLVLVALSLAAAQAEEVVALQEPAGPPRPFLQSATADTLAKSAISTAADAGTPAGLSTSAARMSSETARVRLWRPVSPAVARTIVVQDGQSLWDIAVAWGVSVETIAAANELANADFVKPGQRLVVPVATDPAARAKLAAKAASAVVSATRRPAAAANRTPARTPAVQTSSSRARSSRPRSSAAGSLTVSLAEGQTLWSLGRAHGVSVDSIVEANGLRNANRVRVGTRLVIPGRAAVPRPSRVTTVKVRTQRAGEAFTKAASTAAVRIARGFLWPARGQLTSRFGWRRWRHHDGIDIAAPYGSPIYAARPGHVVFSGWYYAYGRAVIIDHGDGVQTLYGHASTLLVRAGESVGQGQLIARVGASGRATGPHVHFEVRVNGKAVNPMKYMN